MFAWRAVLVGGLVGMSCGRPSPAPSAGAPPPTPFGSHAPAPMSVSPAPSVPWSAPAPPELTITGVRYGHGPYPAPLVRRGASPGDIPFCWMFYLVETEGLRIVVDSGVGDPVAARTYRIQDYAPPEVALEEATGVAAEAVDAVVITHAHDDHAGGLDRFPRAAIHVQRSAYRTLRGRGGRLGRALGEAKAGDRLVVHDGDAEPWPGVGLVATGGHTLGSQAVRLGRGEPRFVVVGDECYFEDHCLSGTPLPDRSVVDGRAHRRFLARLASWIDGGAVPLTLHDPTPSWASTPCAKGSRGVAVTSGSGGPPPR